MHMQSADRIEKLWEQRESILEIRKPSWILKYIWLVPVLAALPILVSNANLPVIISLALLISIFLVYSLFTYHAWRTWPEISEHRKNLAILIVMTYDGLFLSCLVIIFMISTNASLKWLNPQWLQIGSEISAFLVTIIIGVMALQSSNIVNYLTEKHESPLPPATKGALALPSAIIGAGIALGAVLRTSQLGLLITIGLGYLVSFVLLPFAVISFIQVIRMAKQFPAS